MVGISALSLLGGGLFACIAKQIFPIDGAWIGSVLWIAASGAIFWVLWDYKKAYTAREKAQSESRDSRYKALWEEAVRLSASVTGIQEALAAAYPAQKEGLEGIQETLNLLACQIKEADAAILTVLQDGLSARNQALTDLSEQLKTLASRTAEQLFDCGSSISEVAEKADAIMAKLPDRESLHEALEDVPAVKNICEEGFRKLGLNTWSLQEVAGQIKIYNESYRQNLEDMDGRINYILELLTNHYRLLTQIGEQYQ